MEHQQESKQGHDAPSETFSTSTIKPERATCPECSARHDGRRQWLLATSVLLNLMFAAASITVLIVLFAPLSLSSASPSPPTHQNITTPHAHARGNSPVTTCLLGITEADMYAFIDYIGSKSYPGQTCRQVNQEGLIPYQYGALYEVAVAPVGFTGARDIHERGDLSNVNDDFGPGHAHWHPGTDGQPRKIEHRTAPSSRASRKQHTRNHQSHQHSKRTLSGGAIGGIIATAAVIGILVALVCWDQCCR